MNTRYPLYEGVYRILTDRQLKLFRRVLNIPDIHWIVPDKRPAVQSPMVRTHT